MKILNLTLKKEWFDLIARGKKVIEFRTIKPYWEKRLFEKNQFGISVPIKFDEVHFRNGYNNNSPFMRVQFRYTDEGWFNGEKVYAIALGHVLDIKNWKDDDEMIVP